MFKFTVTIAEPDSAETEIDAEYYVTDEGFVTFKDADHKQVATFSAHRVVSVVRHVRATSIGTATIRVVPQFDEAAVDAFIERVSARAAARAFG